MTPKTKQHIGRGRPSMGVRTARKILFNPDDYAVIQNAAAKAKVSTTQFLITAALRMASEPNTKAELVTPAKAEKTQTKRSAILR